MWLASCTKRRGSADVPITQATVQAARRTATTSGAAASISFRSAISFSNFNTNSSRCDVLVYKHTIRTSGHNQRIRGHGALIEIHNLHLRCRSVLQSSSQTSRIQQETQMHFEYGKRIRWLPEQVRCSNPEPSVQHISSLQRRRHLPPLPAWHGSRAPCVCAADTRACLRRWQCCLRCPLTTRPLHGVALTNQHRLQSEHTKGALYSESPVRYLSRRR